MTDLRKLTEAAAACPCYVCDGTAETGSAPFFAVPYCKIRRAYYEAVDPKTILALLKDARCPSEDPKTGYRCEFKLGHGCDLHGYETFAWPVA